VRRSDLITVDSRGTARNGCGDLLHVVEQKHLEWDRLTEIGEVMTGQSQGRSSAQQITLYESHGLGVQDLYVAAKVLELARAAGVGTAVPIEVPANQERVAFV